MAETIKKPRKTTTRKSSRAASSTKSRAGKATETGKRLHFTTLIPVGIEEQLKYVETWRDFADEIITVNHEREVATFDHEIPDWLTVMPVRFARNFGKDFVPFRTLSRAIGNYKYDDANSVTFANSDIAVRDVAAVEKAITSGADLVFSSRMDLDAEGKDMEAYDSGYDLFAFAQSDAGIVDMDEMHVGLPWWDYALPIRAVMDGRKVHRMPSGAITHDWHEQKWDLSTFHYFGARLVQQLTSSPCCPNNEQVLDFARKVNALLNEPALEKGTKKQVSDVADQLKSAFEGVVANASVEVAAKTQIPAAPLNPSEALKFIASRTQGEVAEKKRHAYKLLTKALRPMLSKRYSVGDAEADDYLEGSWSYGESSHRWMTGEEASILFVPAKWSSVDGIRFSLDLRLVDYLVANASDEVELLLNGQSIGSFKVSQPGQVASELPAKLIKPKQLNRITIRTQDAFDAPGDDRRLSACCAEFTFEAV
ncbi:MAG: hypothetical protein RLN72_08280 [Henriciella sp.]